MRLAGRENGLADKVFERTEMTKGVGFDKYWDAGGGW